MSNSPVKYRHPANHDLTWSGKGRRPKWVDAYLANGGSMASLDVAVQYRDDMAQMDDALDAAETAPDEAAPTEIDLGIGDTPAQAAPTFAEKLYGERIAAGLHPVPEEGDQSFTPGVRQVVSAAQASTLPMVDTHSESARVDSIAIKFGVLVTGTEELVQVASDALNTAAVSFVRAGIAFLRIQQNFTESTRVDSTGQESFIDWIEQRGIPKQRVYESISAAKFVMRLPAAEVDRVATVGKSKLKLLASLPQEVIDQAAESGNDLIGKADMMTVAELKDEIKSLTRREKNYEAELERANSQIKRLSEAKKRTTDFLLRTEELREECMALQLGSELHLNSVRRLFEETDPEAPEGTLQVEQLWVVANTIAARALDLLEFMRARVPDGMPERPMTQHALTPEEAIRWLQDYPLIENRFAAEAALRESRREAARPRGPGRPAGSRNKGAEE